MSDDITNVEAPAETPVSPEVVPEETPETSAETPEEPASAPAEAVSLPAGTVVKEFEQNGVKMRRVVQADGSTADFRA